MTDPLINRVLVALIAPIVTVLLAAVLGHRLTAWWNEKQKRRELEFTLANTFYSGYGEFCAIWKEWNFLFSLFSIDSDELGKNRILLQQRASKSEGVIEGVLLKLAAERSLSDLEASDLGRLRQAFQVLRESIQDNEKIDYGHSDHPKYLAFKRLVTLAGNLISTSSKPLPTAGEAFKSFKEITANKHEDNWYYPESNTVNIHQIENASSTHNR